MSSSACDVCPHACAPPPGKLGRCRARAGTDRGTKPAGAGDLTCLALDPIEKKPIARWMPGTRVLSLGGFGCNMRCPWCQNHDIAQAGPGDVRTHRYTPEALVDLARSMAPQGCAGLAYTYNEPLVTWEFVRKTAKLARSAGLVNVLVSNGMANPAVVAQLAPLIDAANIDLKAPTDALYRQIGGRLEPVLQTIRTLREAGCHVEVTTLVVPGFNDQPGQIAQTARFVAGIDPAIPYHLTRFFPRHQMRDVQPTPLRTLHAAKRAAEAHLQDVLLGNV